MGTDRRTPARRRIDDKNSAFSTDVQHSPSLPFPDPLFFVPFSFARIFSSFSFLLLLFDAMLLRFIASGAMLLAIADAAFGRTCPVKPPTTPDPTPGKPGENVPETVVIDGQQLVEARAAFKDGSASAALKSAIEALSHDADDWLNQGPWSVVDKVRKASMMCCAV